MCDTRRQNNKSSLLNQFYSAVSNMKTKIKSLNRAELGFRCKFGEEKKKPNTDAVKTINEDLGNERNKQRSKETTASYSVALQLSLGPISVAEKEQYLSL